MLVERMAKTIQIRDVPEDIHRTLRIRAAAAGVSLSDYLLAEIERVASRPALADVLARAGVRGGGASVESITDAVRADRERT
jgi:plasmid stability protein